MEVTVEGRVIETRLRHSLNIALFRTVSEAGMVMAVSD